MKRHQNDGVSKRCQCPRREWSRCVHPWHLAFKRGGNRYRFSLSRMARTLGEPIPASKTEAKALADRLRGEIRAGRTPVARPVPTPDVSGLTFGDVCDRYLLEYVGEIDTPDGPRWTGQHLRPRTAQQAEYHIGTIRRIPVPAAHGSTIPLEMKPFTNVNTTDIKTVQAARRSHGLVGCNRLMARLRHLFTWSIVEGLTDRSPFTRGGVSLVTLDHRAETERTRRLQPGERSRLLQHAHPHLQALIIAALSTGCRLGELLSLQWSQIQRDEKREAQLIVLPASKTKTHDLRVIPVSSDLRAVLEMRRTDPKGEALPPEVFVFGNQVGERIGSVKTAWRNTCRRAGIDGLRFHDLRREFACQLLESAADLHDVRDFLGHANITTTSRYLRSSPVRLVQALERMEAAAVTSADADEPPQVADVR